MCRRLLCVVLCVATGACEASGGPADAGVVRVDVGEGGDTGSLDARGPIDGGPARPDAPSRPSDAGALEIDDAGTWDPGPPCPVGCAAGTTCCREAAGWSCVAVPDGGACPGPDLEVNPERLTSVTFGWENFDPTDCTVAERCVQAPGWRRLMRFPVQTANVGTGDMSLGTPGPSNPIYTRSACSGEYLFHTYGRYYLLDDGGDVVARGMKQAFCIMDTDRWSFEPDVRAGPQFDCRDQGISRGWSDVYTAGLTCQWVDVTDVPPGEYTLRVQLNIDRRIHELDYDNNTVDVTLTVPADTSSDPTTACAGGGTGGGRDCGWTAAGTFSCTPGATAMAQCGTGAGCDGAACTGDPVIRLCAGDEVCDSRASIGAADDCRMGVYCPVASFTCPAEGRVTVMTAAYQDGEAYGCTVSVR